MAPRTTFVSGLAVSPWGRGPDARTEKLPDAANARDVLRQRERNAIALKDGKQIRSAVGRASGGLSVADAKSQMIEAGEQPLGMARAVEHIGSEAEGFTGTIFFTARDNQWHASVTYSDGSGYDFEGASKPAVLSAISTQALTDLAQTNVDEQARTAPWKPEPMGDGETIAEAHERLRQFVESTNFCRQVPEYFACGENADILLAGLRMRHWELTLEHLVEVFDDAYTKRRLIERPAPEPVVVERVAVPHVDSEAERKRRSVILVLLRGLPTLPRLDENGEPTTLEKLATMELSQLEEVLQVCQSENHDLRHLSIEELKALEARERFARTGTIGRTLRIL